MNEVFNFSVDKLYGLLFTTSPFLRDFMEQRRFSGLTRGLAPPQLSTLFSTLHPPPPPPPSCLPLPISRSFSNVTLLSLAFHDAPAPLGCSGPLCHWYCRFSYAHCPPDSTKISQGAGPASSLSPQGSLSTPGHLFCCLGGTRCTRCVAMAHSVLSCAMCGPGSSWH